MPWLSIARRDDGGPEYRGSDWPVTDGLNHGRACPVCHCTVHKGARWRAHALKEARDAELFNELVQAVRVIAEALERRGIVTVRIAGGEDQEEAEEAPVGGIVIGSGDLPAEMRGGGK